MGARRSGGLGLVIRCLLGCVRAHLTIVSFLGGPSFFCFLAPFFPTPSLGYNTPHPCGPGRCGLQRMPTATPMASLHPTRLAPLGRCGLHQMPTATPMASLQPTRLAPPPPAPADLGDSNDRTKQQVRGALQASPVATPHWHPPGFYNGFCFG